MIVSNKQSDNQQSKNQLIDSFGRVHTNLRISVTDRCNIRCFYCMPEELVQFKPREELLTFEEFVQFTRALVPYGVHKLRITGGEPLVREELPKLISMLAQIDGIDDIGLTTNGILLAKHAQALKAAGLNRLNISLDGMSEATFQKITRRSGLEKVFQGIDAAKSCGFEKIKLNAIAIRGITEIEIVPLAQFAREQNLELRFIEYMPLGASDQWEMEKVLTGNEIRQMLQDHFTKLLPIKNRDPSQPAVDFAFADGAGQVGFINSVSQPFCSDCNRIRLTAEGKLRNCLFSYEEWDVRSILRSKEFQTADMQNAEIVKLVKDCLIAKKLGHGIDSPQFVKPPRAMFQIGG